MEVPVIRFRMPRHDCIFVLPSIFSENQAASLKGRFVACRVFQEEVPQDPEFAEPLGEAPAFSGGSPEGSQLQAAVGSQEVGAKAPTSVEMFAHFAAIAPHSYS